MKKRMRKKKNLAEYAVWGRQLIATRNTKADPDLFHEDFIIKAIENNGCFCGGRLSDDQVDVIVELGYVSENLEERFAKITDWLDARDDVEKWQAGDLFDLNKENPSDIG